MYADLEKCFVMKEKEVRKSGRIKDNDNNDNENIDNDYTNNDDDNNHIENSNNENNVIIVMMVMELF